MGLETREIPMITPQQRQKNLADLYAIKDGQARLNHLFNQIRVPATIEGVFDAQDFHHKPCGYIVTLDCSQRSAPDLLEFLARLQNFSGVPLVFEPDNTAIVHRELIEEESTPEIRAVQFLEQGVSDLIETIISRTDSEQNCTVALVLDNGPLDEF
jgi:hypothetical protein